MNRSAKNNILRHLYESPCLSANDKEVSRAKIQGHRVNEMVFALVFCAQAVTLGFVLGISKPTVKASKPLLAQQTDEKVIERYTYSNEPISLSN